MRILTAIASFCFASRMLSVGDLFTPDRYPVTISQIAAACRDSLMDSTVFWKWRWRKYQEGGTFVIRVMAACVMKPMW